jgi:hypothetical protein
MKQFIQGALLCIAFTTLASFTHLQKHKFPFVKHEEKTLVPKKIVEIGFTIPYGGCTLFITATINTASGQGYGALSMDCGGGRPPRTITFSIITATISLKAQITVLASGLANFLDVDTNTDPELSAGTKQAIAAGITANGYFDE